MHNLRPKFHCREDRMDRMVGDSKSTRTSALGVVSVPGEALWLTRLARPAR